MAGQQCADPEKHQQAVIGAAKGYMPCTWLPQGKRRQQGIRRRVFENLPLPDDAERGVCSGEPLCISQFQMAAVTADMVDQKRLNVARTEHDTRYQQLETYKLGMWGESDLRHRTLLQISGLSASDKWPPAT